MTVPIGVNCTEFNANHLHFFFFEIEDTFVFDFCFQNFYRTTANMSRQLHLSDVVPQQQNALTRTQAYRVAYGSISAMIPMHAQYTTLKRACEADPYEQLLTERHKRLCVELQQHLTSSKQTIARLPDITDPNTEKQLYLRLQTTHSTRTITPKAVRSVLDGIDETIFDRSTGATRVVTPKNKRKRASPTTPNGAGEDQSTESVVEPTVSPVSPEIAEASSVIVHNILAKLKASLATTSTSVEVTTSCERGVKPADVDDLPSNVSALANAFRDVQEQRKASRTDMYARHRDFIFQRRQCATTLLQHFPVSTMETTTTGGAVDANDTSNTVVPMTTQRFPLTLMSNGKKYTYNISAFNRKQTGRLTISDCERDLTNVVVKFLSDPANQSLLDTSAGNQENVTVSAARYRLLDVLRTSVPDVLTQTQVSKTTFIPDVKITMLWGRNAKNADEHAEEAGPLQITDGNAPTEELETDVS